MPKIFVSHYNGVHDTEFAKAFTTLLKDALGAAPVVDVICTSLAPYALEPGVDFAATLRQMLHESRIVVGLLTQASIRRSWVLFELGHAWSGAKSIALLAGDLNRDAIPGPLANQHAITASDRGSMWTLLRKIGAVCDLPVRPEVEAEPAMTSFIAKIAELNSELKRAPMWTDARIATDRGTLFDSALKVLMDANERISRVDIYAPTGVWEIGYPEKKRWFQGLAKCLANDRGERPEWPVGEVVDDDILHMTTRIGKLNAVFGLPPEEPGEYVRRIGNITQALKWLHGISKAYIYRSLVDTSTIPGTGYIRIDDTLASAWAVNGEFGVDTALIVHDRRVSTPVGNWFDDNAGKLRDRPAAEEEKLPARIQYMPERDRGLCLYKGMQRIRLQLGLDPGPGCAEH